MSIPHLKRGRSGTRSLNKNIIDQLDAAYAPLYLPTYTTATLPTPSAAIAGQLVRVSDGNAGAACLAECNGAAWKVIALGATCSAT